MFYKWYLSSQVDFWAPPLKAIADFPLYLFQDRKLQPGTIDGYRPAIVNNLGICPLMSAKMKISLISWIVSTETDPREEGHPLLEPFPGSTPANKAPFEPLKEASLKHLTIKTAFLLALGSCKRRVRSMLGCITNSDTRLVHGVFLPLSQPSFQESAGQRESRHCGPHG